MRHLCNGQPYFHLVKIEKKDAVNMAHKAHHIDQIFECLSTPLKSLKYESISTDSLQLSFW